MEVTSEVMNKSNKLCKKLGKEERDRKSNTTGGGGSKRAPNWMNLHPSYLGAFILSMDEFHHWNHLDKDMR